jgi:hypothetical protein
VVWDVRADNGGGVGKLCMLCACVCMGGIIVGYCCGVGLRHDLCSRRNIR